MYCQGCGREIADDSTFCSHCGNKVEHEQIGHTEHQDSDCVRPGMPKKKCADCGKELPGSWIADICSICAMRKQNRDRDAESERSQQWYAASSGDRYDRSSRFDQSVFERDRKNYYHDSALDGNAIRTAERDIDPKRGRWQKQAFDDRPKLKKNRPGCVLAIFFFIIFSIIAPALFALIPAHLFSFGESHMETESIPVSSNAPQMESVYTTESLNDDVFIGTESLSGDKELDKLFSKYVSHHCVDMLANYYEDAADADVLREVWFDLEDFTYSQAYIFVSGSTHHLVFEDEANIPVALEDDVMEVDRFELCLIGDTEGIYYIPVSLFINGELIYDVSDQIDRNGNFTEIAQPELENPEDYLAGGPLFIRDLL